jgi:ribonucleotide monophosphatase NagD (HAD superfamily)
MLGKPSPLFFALTVQNLVCAAENIAMIEAEADVGGAMTAGLMDALVQTGKYQSGQEKEQDPPAMFFAQNLTDAIDFLLS